MQLSTHFSLEEFTLSQTVARQGIKNDPTPTEIDNMRVCAQGLERVRELLGNKPIFISSGYRSAILNRAIGGARMSAHIAGWAADFVCPAFGSPLKICLAIQHRMTFDQLIYEFSWVHLSMAPSLRNTVLTYKGGGYQQGLPLEVS